MTISTLRYGFGETTVGTVLVAMSKAGVVAISIGHRDRLLRELAAARPDARLVADETAAAEPIRQVARFLADPRSPLDFALDSRGSDAERAVWAELRTIPVGETRSYSQIAKALPMPITAREVGAACAANVIALAIPCHRVVKADGGISGYRWGVACKRRLLTLEATA